MVSDHRIVLPDGSVRFHRDEAVVEVDASGDPVRVVGTTRDVTESRRAEQALRASVEEKTEVVPVFWTGR